MIPPTRPPGGRKYLERPRPTRAILIAALSVITPAGLVMVNVAAYVMRNLAAFRVGITVFAVVSTLVLNGITVIAAYRLGAGRWPDRWLFNPARRTRLAIVGGVLLILGAGLAGWLTYGGLSDPTKLPNLTSFLAGMVGLAIPIGALFLFREEVNPRLRRRYRTR
jgi:hypothetical protein